MIRRVAAFILAVVLASQSAHAEAFDRTGYKLGPAVEYLVTRNKSVVDTSKKAEAELLVMYAIAFGERLAGLWPEKLPEKFGSRAFTKMSTILALENARNPGLFFAVSAGTDDAKVFASRYDRNSEEAMRVFQAVILLVGK